MRLLFILSVALSALPAFATDDCGSLRDRNVDSLAPQLVAPSWYRSQLQDIAQKAGTTLTSGTVPIVFITNSSNSHGGKASFRLGAFTATFADGRHLNLCPAWSEEKGCDGNSKGLFSWELMKYDRADAFGLIVGYECRLTSFPLPFPALLNADTGKAVVRGAPRGLYLTEVH